MALVAGFLKVVLLGTLVGPRGGRLQPPQSPRHALVSRSALRMLVEEQPVRTPITADSFVLVVGASRGLGLEFGRQIAAKGATVFATYRGDTAPAALSTLADAHPGRFHPLPLDVSDDASVEAALSRVQALAKAPRPLSLVVHNAGM
jgi:hypothetical protein